MELEKEIHQVKGFRNDYQKASVNIIYTGKWMMQFHADVFKPYNLTIQQYNILRILRGQHPNAATVKLIRERMLDRMSDASRIVELLRKKGLIERTICEGDRRRMDVIITENGLQVLQEIDKESERMDKRLSSLNEQEISQLNFLLDKIRNIISLLPYILYPLSFIFSEDSPLFY
jgi:DNA-binding MarR family transcriptional regulator